MAQFKYQETQRLRQWDILGVIGALIVTGLIVLVQVLMSGQANRNILLFLSLGILLLSGIFYYLNSLRMIARYSEKSIKLSMMPVGTVKRKIKWSDVVESEIVNTPRKSKWNEWANQFASLDQVVSGKTDTCLHLKLKNNEEINIGCANPNELKQFVSQIKDLQTDNS